MNDMDVYLLLTLLRKQYSLPEEGIRQLLTEALDLPVTKDDMAKILNYPPKTKQLVHALHDKGFSQKFIQEYLSLAQSTVSYHLGTEPHKPYQNDHLTWLRLTWADRILKVRSNL